MIRPSDLATTAAWARPASAAPTSDGVYSTHWFRGDVAQAPAITGDVSPQARSLSAEQHAKRVLAHLQDPAF